MLRRNPYALSRYVRLFNLIVTMQFLIVCISGMKVDPNASVRDLHRIVQVGIADSTSFPLFPLEARIDAPEAIDTFTGTPLV